MRLFGRGLALADPAALAAAALGRRFGDEGQKAAVKGSRLTCAGYTVEVAATVENDQQRDGQHLIGVGFGISLNSRAVPALYAGTVGTAASREEALREAVEDWSRLVGAAPAYALVSSRTTAAQAFGRYRVFPGATGLRGETEVDQLKGVHTALFTALAPWKEYLPAPQDDLDLHTLSIMVVVDAGGAVQGECRYDSPGTACFSPRSR